MRRQIEEVACEDWLSEHRSALSYLDRDVLAQALMRPELVVIPDVLTDQATHPGLAEDQDVVQALSADASVEALEEGVHHRDLGRGKHKVDATGLGQPFERVAELVVVVEDQVVWLDVPGGGLAELLSHPTVRWMARDAEVDDAPGVNVHDEEREDGPKQHVSGMQEVTGPDLLGVVVDEGMPGPP